MSEAFVGSKLEKSFRRVFAFILHLHKYFHAAYFCYSFQLGVDNCEPILTDISLKIFSIIVLWNLFTSDSSSLLKVLVTPLIVNVAEN